MTGELHSTLLDPSTYPHAPEKIEFIETHISRIYIAGGKVYKIKKAVDFGFLDFTTLEKRRRDCEQEVRLNRRFCPDTYLGVVPLVKREGKIFLGGEGKILEYAVEMRRLPLEELLSRGIEKNDPALPSEMPRLGRHLARLHRDAPIVGRSAVEDDRMRIRRQWDQNFDQCAPFEGVLLPSPTLRAAKKQVSNFLARHASTLERRQLEGYVRENHGDLHSQHICLGHPIRIFDCIEFNRDFRIGDLASDLAFLLMDLEFSGRFDLSRGLLESYLRQSRDEGLPRLLRFYKLYRAFVRAKVEGLHWQSLEPQQPIERERAARRAKAYFALGASYLCPPLMILLCGRMGTGKSTLAAALQEQLRLRIIRSDVLRQELSGQTRSEGDAFGRGIYGRDWTQRTYRALLDEARASLKLGQSVALDASFSSAGQRERFRQEAAELALPCLTLYLDCPDELALKRLEERQARGTDPSEGRPELYALQGRNFEPPRAEPGLLHVDSAGEIKYTSGFVFNEILERLGSL